MTRAEATHIPVLLGPVLDGLNIRSGGCYVDGTFGRGGHSREILKRLGPDGRLLAIDRDPQAERAAEALNTDPRFTMVRGELADLEQIARKYGFMGKVDGLLLDLGVSSPQLDDASRGFSFRSDGPLDMRMDPTSGRSAAEWLAQVDEKTLRTVLRDFGEERFAPRIAREILRLQRETPMSRTGELADAVASCVPQRGQRKHPATKTFQAIRIAVNDELGQLDKALKAIPAVLNSGGRACVISFHSLEDRRVKRYFREMSREPEQYRGLPTIPEEFRPPMRMIGRAIKASDSEIAANVRARSARLRIAERV